MHPLRPYQHRTALAALREPNPLLVAPTGSGKTTIGVYIAQALASRGVVWLTHREELIEQAVERFAAHGIVAGVVQASRPATPEASIQVASVQTLARREPLPAAVYIIDEAHHAAAESYRRSIPETAKRIGLTATPFRTDGKGLGDVFDSIVVAATPAELISDGVLLDPDVWIVRPPDMAGVTKRGGDFAPGEAGKRTDTAERRADIVAQWRLRCEGLRTLAFATSVEHSKAIAAAFEAEGIPALHVDADTPRDDRRAAVRLLESGDIEVLSNVALFTEGFDLPAISAIIDAAPTDSMGRHIQKIGRVLRTSPGKTRAIVHDHAGNHLRLGRVTRTLNYTLDAGITREPSEPLGLRTCSTCFRMYAGGVCPECGAEPDPVDVPALDGLAGMSQLSEHQIREAVFDRICEEQGDRKDGWVLHQYRERFNEWPPTCRPDGEDGPMVYVNPETAGPDLKRAYYRDMLAMALDKGWSVGSASHRYRDLFGVWPKGFVNEVKQELGVEVTEWT